MTAAAASGRPVRRFGSARVLTTVWQESGELRLTRRRGDPLTAAEVARRRDLLDRVALCPLPPAVVTPTAVEVSFGDVRMDEYSRPGHRYLNYHYVVAGPRLLADWVVGAVSSTQGDHADTAAADLSRLCGAAGRELAGFHSATEELRAPVPGGRLDPPSLTRVRHWLGEEDGRAGPGQLRAALQAVVGDGFGDRLLSVLTFDPTRVCHGAPGQAYFVAEAPKAGALQLLTGEDLCVGTRGLDIGWFLGELVEREFLTRSGSLWPEAAAALVSGFGGLDGCNDWGVGALLRLLAHAHDFASQVGWHPALRAYAELVATYLADRDAFARLLKLPSGGIATGPYGPFPSC